MPPTARSLAAGPCTGAVGRDRVLARSAACAAGACGLVHGVLLLAVPLGWATAGQAVLTLACLPCAVHLWRRPRPAAWAVHAGVALAMMLTHPLAMGAADHAHGHASMPAVAGWAGAAVPLLAGLGLFLAVVRWWGGTEVRS